MRRQNIIQILAILVMLLCVALASADIMLFIKGVCGAVAIVCFFYIGYNYSLRNKQTPGRLSWVVNIRRRFGWFMSLIGCSFVILGTCRFIIALSVLHNTRGNEHVASRWLDVLAGLLIIATGVAWITLGKYRADRK
jgi:hypothetical protein